MSTPDDLAEFDDDLDDEAHDHDPESPCSCAAHNAQEMHDLASLMAEEKGADLCDPDAEPVHDRDIHHAADLLVIHDLAIAQGAHCPGHDEDDEDDEDEDDIDDLDLDEDDFDGSSDEHPAFSAGHADRPSPGPRVTTPPIEFG